MQYTIMQNPRVLYSINVFIIGAVSEAEETEAEAGAVPEAN